VAWPSGRIADIGPVPHPDGPTLAPHGGSFPSRTIDQDTATGPVARPPRPAEKTGRGGEPDGRTRRRNRPDPAGRGAWQTVSCPAPWPVAGAGVLDAMAGPPGSDTAARPPVLLSDNPVVCHTTKCGSGTISSPRTWNP
jgi:hypothetical protein